MDEALSRPSSSSGSSLKTETAAHMTEVYGNVLTWRKEGGTGRSASRPVSRRLTRAHATSRRHRRGAFMLLVQQVRGRRIRHRYEDTEHRSGDVGAVLVGVYVGGGGEQHDERDEVQHRLDGVADQLRQHPVDGDSQRLPDAEQVHEAPHERGDEGGHRHKHEPRRVVGGCQDHAKEAEHQLNDF